MLAPMINIIRIPEGGRNFELFSEDPFLSSHSSVAVINGIQDVGILANAKVITANNQETWRHTINEIIPERALREIYLPSFEASVKEANVSTIMTGYNKINNIYCSEHSHLLRKITKDEWGFEGFIMTDWGTRHKAISAANAGLDMEMPGTGENAQFRKHLADAVKSGEVSEETLNEMVYRILHEMKRFGLIGKNREYPKGLLNAPEHKKLAYEIALEGAVLLKNDNNTLPLNPANVKKIALFGDARNAMCSGGGSSLVLPFYSVSPYEGIKNRIENAEVIHYEDYRSAPGGEVAVVCISSPSTENKDRETSSLFLKSEIIDAVSGKYDKVIVLLRTAGGYSLPWIDKVDAVFQMWFPGQEEGNAEAALIFGDVSPSGKLPVTFGKERSDYPAVKSSEFPGIDEKVIYSEGIFVGYRFFEKYKTNVLFPFGHGLSYSDFEYNNLKISTDHLMGNDSLIISYTIKNIGNMEAAEVSQLYISDLESSVKRPVKELKGFDKTLLKPGETKTIQLTVNKKDLSFWDKNSNNWIAENGRFKILIGASAADLRLKGTFSYSN